MACNIEAGNMAASGNYTQISLNRALKTMGLNGARRPDVIGIAGKAIKCQGPKDCIFLQGVAIVDSAGKLITTYGSEQFTPGVQEMVIKLFGR